MIEDYSQYCSTRKEALKKGQLFYFTGKECPKGHLSLRYTSIGRCLECGKEASQRLHKGVQRSAEKQEARAKRIIESFDYTYLGQERRGLRQKVHFIYDCGIKEHENKSVTLSNLERTYLKKLEIIEENKSSENNRPIPNICRSCGSKKRADDNPAHSIKDLREFAKREFGGNCLSPKYTRSRDFYFWDCSNPFHQPFPQRWDSVKSKNSWCPECWKERRGKAQRGDIGPVKDAISVWGGKIRKHWWEGALIVEVECPNGHVWTALATSLKKGHGCAECKNKGERIVRAFLEHNLGYKFPSSRPDWLQRNTRGSYQLDGFNEEHKIAFEYQGPHHKKSDQIERDQYKKSKCDEKNIRLIYIEYEEKVFPLEIWTSLLTDVFKEHGLTSIHEQIEHPVEPIFVSELEELRQLGKQKGAILKSTEYMGETLPHLWDCGVKEHPDFAMSPYRLRKGVWCSRCRGNNKRTLDDIHSFCSSNEISFNSKEWLGGKESHYWSCKKDHWWKTPKGTLAQYIGKGKPACPFCGNGSTNNLFQGDVATLIKLKGGKSLKGELKNAKSEFEFKCPNGHDVKRNWNKLQQGFFCQETNCEHNKKNKISLGEIRQNWKPADFFDQKK